LKEICEAGDSDKFPLVFISTFGFISQHGITWRIIQVYDFEEMRKASMRLYCLLYKNKYMYRIEIFFFIFHVYRSIVRHELHTSCYGNFTSPSCTAWCKFANNSNLRFVQERHRCERTLSFVPAREKVETRFFRRFSTERWIDRKLSCIVR